MRAITQNEFGGPEVLHIAEVADPEPLPTEVVVRVKAVGVNPVESFIRSGGFPLLGEPPFILGWDISGVVEHAVPGTNRFREGDEVFGMPLFPRAGNGYAELVAAPSRQLARKPHSLTFEQAAALPLTGLTAWQSLVDVANVQAGQRVLIHGGGGGVGHLAIQIAKARGAFVVTTASATKREFVESLGADEVIDYNSTDFTKATGQIDVVLDPIGNGYAQRSLDVLKTNGLLITLVERTDEELRQLSERQEKRFAGVSVEPDGPGLEALADLATQGKLTVHVQHRVSFDQAAEAHRLLDGSTTGKIVLVP